MPLIEATASVTFVSTADILLFISVKLPSVAKPSVFPFNSLMAPTMFFAEVSKLSVPIFVFIELIPAVFVSTRPANSVKADASALEFNSSLVAKPSNTVKLPSSLAPSAVSKLSTLLVKPVSSLFIKFVTLVICSVIFVTVSEFDVKKFFVASLIFVSTSDVVI